VKRCVSCLSVLTSVFCFTVGVALADEAGGSITGAPRAANDFAGMIISGVAGKRVGIGTREPAATLDVYQGEVKIGSTGAPCTKALAGAIRYSDTRLQLCDGTGWRNVSLDKAQ
jgi:hypothetical protein